MSEQPIKSIRPSKSEQPGPKRFMAALMVDPWYFIFRIVVFAAEGITNAILKNRKKKKPEPKKPPPC